MSGGQIATIILVPLVLAWGAYGVLVVYRWVSGRPVWPIHRESNSTTRNDDDTDRDARP